VRKPYKANWNRQVSPAYDQTRLKKWVDAGETMDSFHLQLKGSKSWNQINLNALQPQSCTTEFRNGDIDIESPETATGLVVVL